MTTRHPLLLDNDDDTTIPTRNLSTAKQKQQQQQQQQTVLQRHLSLFDLVSVGIGATVGSGIFVLTGFIAHTLSGPAVSCSWLLAGLAACLSGLCYAELGGRYPSVGSTYVYAKVTMGTYASVVAAACLTLEYIGR
jgi:amino acid transporter